MLNKELELSPVNVKRLTEMRAFFKSYEGTLESWISNISKTFLKAMREVDGQDTEYHLHCLRHTFAVRRYLQTSNIYLVKEELGHSSVVTTEIYTKFHLRRLKNDFPALVKDSKNAESWVDGTLKVGHTYNDLPVDQIISGVRTS